MSKPVIARLANGAEYGFRDAETARRKHPGATIVAYQDGTAWEGDGDEAPSLSTMTRPELEAYAADLGIENPADKGTFPNVDALREAIEAARVDREGDGNDAAGGRAGATGDAEA